MVQEPFNLRITILIFCLLLLPSAACAAPLPAHAEYPEQILSDPTPLHVWNVPLKIVLLGILSTAIPPAYFTLIESLSLLSTWLYLGQKRILKQNVLDNGTRQRIYACIQENPGIYLSSLSKKLEINIGTLRYHLRVLCKMGKIVSEQDSGFMRFYINNRIYSDQEMRLNGCLCNDSKKRIMDLILQNPGINRSEIAFRLKLSGSGVAWHMKTLIMEGLVRSERNGRYVNYFLSSDITKQIRVYTDANKETNVFNVSGGSEV